MMLNELSRKILGVKTLHQKRKFVLFHSGHIDKKWHNLLKYIRVQFHLVCQSLSSLATLTPSSVTMNGTLSPFIPPALPHCSEPKMAARQYATTSLKGKKKYNMPLTLMMPYALPSVIIWICPALCDCTNDIPCSCTERQNANEQKLAGRLVQPSVLGRRRWKRSSFCWCWASSSGRRSRTVSRVVMARGARVPFSVLAKCHLNACVF